MKYLKLIIALLLTGAILLSCSTSSTLVYTDDMYPGNVNRDTTRQIVKKVRTYNNYYDPNYRSTQWNYYYSYPYYNPYQYYYPYNYYRPNTIIVIPKNDYNYGKRPDRQGISVPINGSRRRN